MKAWFVMALAGLAGLSAACSDDDATGEGGYTPGVINVAAGTGPGTTQASGSQSSSQSSSAQSSSQASTATGTSVTSVTVSTGGMLSDPLLPYCGCIVDNLASPGLCRTCWEEAIVAGGSCSALMEDCGPACGQMLDALPTECASGVTPACLDAVAGIAPNQVDDFEAVLGCLCNCTGCDAAACR